jgi:hypothetical protein
MSNSEAKSDKKTNVVRLFMFFSVKIKEIVFDCFVLAGNLHSIEQRKSESVYSAAHSVELPSGSAHFRDLPLLTFLCQASEILKMSPKKWKRQPVC